MKSKFFILALTATVLTAAQFQKVQKLEESAKLSNVLITLGDDIPLHKFDYTYE